VVSSAFPVNVGKIGPGETFKLPLSQILPNDLMHVFWCQIADENNGNHQTKLRVIADKPLQYIFLNGSWIKNNEIDLPKIKNDLSIKALSKELGNIYITNLDASNTVTVFDCDLYPDWP